MLRRDLVALLSLYAKPKKLHRAYSPQRLETLTIGCVHEPRPRRHTGLPSPMIRHVLRRFVKQHFLP